MDNLMLVATQLISRESQRVEVSANNISNVATPGYKRQVAFQSVLGAEAAQQLLEQATQTPAAAQAMSRATDFSAGKLQHTGNPYDLTVTGPGFLQLATDQGSVYARTATLHRDADGRLLTAQGWRLQAAGGGDVVVSGENWKLERDGTVVDAGNPVSAVRLVEFEDLSKLTRAGSNYFAATSDARSSENLPGAAGTLASSVQQGYVEAANVSVGNDMIQIMEAMRRIESGQKLVHVYDDMVGTALQRLGGM
jgi:flagellar basal-body rod protein FlgG